MLCFLANDDLIGARKAMQNYQIDDPHFDTSRELELLVAITEAIQAKSEPDYIKAVGAYAKVTPFDKVKNQLLARTKEVHLPEQSSLAAAGISTKKSKLNFIDNDEDEDGGESRGRPQRHNPPD